MTKFITPLALDAALGYVAERADLMVLCSAAPGDYTEAATAVSASGRRIAAGPVVTGLGNGAFALATTPDGGRKLIVERTSSILGEEAGTATHVALLDTAGTALLLVTELAEPFAIGVGQNATIEAFEDAIAAPV
ncbi:MAG: hypothetical protein AAGE18_11305 [Pseudomonadota bacterium]